MTYMYDWRINVDCTIFEATNKWPPAVQPVPDIVPFCYQTSNVAFAKKFTDPRASAIVKNVSNKTEGSSKQ